MAEEFKGGVTYFTKGILSIPVFFPEDKVKCCYCPFCRSEGDLKRFWCRAANEMIYNPFYAGLPEFCPIETTGEITGTKKGD